MVPPRVGASTWHGGRAQEGMTYRSNLAHAHARMHDVANTNRHILTSDVKDPFSPDHPPLMPLGPPRATSVQKQMFAQLWCLGEQGGRGTELHATQYANTSEVKIWRGMFVLCTKLPRVPVPPADAHAPRLLPTLDQPIPHQLPRYHMLTSG